VSQLGIEGIYLPVGITPKGNLAYLSFHGQKSNASYSCVPLAQRWYSTRDLDYATRVYPFLRDVAQFWENYLVYTNNYNGVPGGRYVDFNDAAHENYTPADVNPIVSLSFIRLVLNCALDMSTALGVDASRQANWRNILSKLSAYPTCKVADLPSQYRPADTSLWPLPIFRFTESGQAWWNGNTVGIQHIYPGNGIGLDSSPDLLQRAKNQITVLNRWRDGNGMTSFYPAAVRVGYDPATILSNLSQMVTAWGWANGFYIAGGGWMENESIVPTTIQEMLMQSQEGVIRFFPCWSRNLNARFGDLRAYGAFLVSAQLNNRVVSGVRIFSEKGRLCTLQNPWPGSRVAVYRNGRLGEVVTGARFMVPTLFNETLDLAPATDYEVWAQQIPDLFLRAPLADADGDGHANLLEYVTGGNPAVSDNRSDLGITTTNGLVQLSFTRNTNSVTATIILQNTPVLGPGGTWVGVATNQNGVWTGPLPVQEMGAGNPRSVVLRDTRASRSQFYRLRVIQR
jgi:hypothetical protein